MSQRLLLLLKLLLLLLILCATPIGPLSAQTSASDMCQSGKITVWGEAPIFSSESAARNKAKEDACRRAIEKCIGQEVAAATGVSDGQSILNEIFSKTRGICKNDRLVKEEKYDIDTIKMLKAFYRFTVKPAELTDKINLMQKLVGNPKLMVLIREVYKLPQKKVEGFHSRNGLTAKLLRAFLVKQGYSVIDAAKIRPYLKNESQVAGTPQNVNVKIKDAAVRAGADVLIIGTVEAEQQQLASLEGTGLKSFRAVGNVTLVSLWGSGRILGEYSDSKPGTQVSPQVAARVAIRTMVNGRKKSKKIAGMLAYVDKRLKAEWAAATRNNKIEIHITGLDPQVAGIFRDNLLESTAVKNIDEIESSAQAIRWELTYPGRSFALADTISFYRENPKIFPILKRSTCGPIQVKRIQRGAIHLHFTKPCRSAAK